MSSNYGSTLTLGFFVNSFSPLTYFDMPFAGISESGSSMVAVTRAQNSLTQAIFPSSNYGASFTAKDGELPLGLAVSLTPVSGITNSYVTVFDFQSQFFYSTDGGFTAWYTKATGYAYFKHIYRKALNTPTTTTTTTTAAPVPYTIDNAATGSYFDACNGSTTTSTVYAQSGNTVPYVSMILYDSAALTTPFVGSSGWRKLIGPVGTYAVEIDTNGEITNYVTCL